MATGGTDPSWSDWLPDSSSEAADWITREELIGALRDAYAERVTTNQLRHWESLAVIPKPVKRWHEATHSTRAMYPREAAWLVSRLVTLRREGMTYPEIAERLRESAHEELDNADRRQRWDEVRSAFSDQVLPGLDAYARRYEQVTGVPILRAVVTFFDADGQRRSTHASLIPGPHPIPEQWQPAVLRRHLPANHPLAHQEPEETHHENE